MNVSKLSQVPVLTLLALLLLPSSSHAGKYYCVPEYSTKELCVFKSANMSRIKNSPEVLLAAKVVAKKMKPYFPASFPMMKLVMGYRSAEEQERIRRSGVRAGPSRGPFVSAHIYGVAVDIEIEGNRKLGRQMCAALNQIIPLLKNKGGVIMEGSGGGSTNGHIDDNWGARFSMEKFGVKKTLNYTGGECPETFGVKGPSAAEFAEMAKITVDSLEKDTAYLANGKPDDKLDVNADKKADPAADEEEEDDEDSAKAEPAKDTKARKPSSWEKAH